MRKSVIVGLSLLLVIISIIGCFALVYFMDISDGGHIEIKLDYEPSKILFHPQYKKLFILKSDLKTLEIFNGNLRWDIKKERDYTFKNDILDFFFEGENCYLIQRGEVKVINIKDGDVLELKEDWSNYKKVICNEGRWIFIDSNRVKAFGITQNLPGEYVDCCLTEYLMILLLKNENCIWILDRPTSSKQHIPFKLNSTPKDIEMDDNGKIYVLFENSIEVYRIVSQPKPFKFVKRIKINESFDKFFITPRSNEVIGINDNGIYVYEWIYIIRNKWHLSKNKTRFHDIFIYGKNKYNWELFYYDLKENKIKVYWSYSEGYDQKELENYPKTRFWKTKNHIYEENQ